MGGAALIQRAVIWLLVALLFTACGETTNHAQATIRNTHRNQVHRWIERNFTRHRKGVALVAQRLAPGFAVEPEDARRSQMRVALRLMSQPPKGVSELIASPKSFIAAIDANGIVIARDTSAEHDQMQGQNLKLFEPVEKALKGTAAEGLVTFSSLDKGEASVSLIFAYPVRMESQPNASPVGAIVVGIPLWRLAQQLSQQLRLTYAKQTTVVLWVYLVHQGRLHHFGTPPEVDQALPEATHIVSALASKPKGYTGQFNVVGRPYAYGVYPEPMLSADTAVLIVRSNPL